MTPEFIGAIIEGSILLSIGYWMGHVRGWSRGYGEAAGRCRESSVDLIEAVKKMKP